MGQLDGKVAILTGAGRGIGRAVALLFGQEGAKVAAISRTKETFDATVREIEEAGGTAIAIQCDVTSKEQIDAAVAAWLPRNRDDPLRPSSQLFQPHQQHP